jgi:ATP-binding cassette subfamily F protein 3
LTGDTALQPVGSLSGGERCRASLARLSAADANFLVLDEPTNHLDLWARDALENAIKKFDGTVLFVSHDRYFVNRVADHVLAIEPDHIRLVEGNYDEYQRKLRGAGDNPEDAPGEVSSPARAKSGKAQKQSTQTRRFPYRKVSDLEDEIFMRETCIQERQRELMEPDVLRNGERVREIKQQIEQEQAAVKTLYEHWEEASDLNW